MKMDWKTAENGLEKKGFRRDVSDDLIDFFHLSDGKETGIKTYVSHSAKDKDIGPDNLRNMIKQLRLQTLQEVRDLLEFPMTGDHYNDFLKREGLFVSDESTGQAIR